MAEELKGLIDKINEEGVRSAEAKAAAIEDKARLEARRIITKAEEEALRIMEEAKGHIARMEDGAKTSIKQAARDTLLSVRKEIESMLAKLIGSHVQKTLASGEMSKVIADLIKQCAKEDVRGVIVSVRKEDLAALEGSLFGELKDDLKKALTLKSREDIKGGFTISYDAGRSYYDFTDQALAEYIGTYLKPKLAEILKEVSAKDKKD